MPSECTLKAMNAGHRLILAVTFGRLGWTAGKMPVLELTTTGRKTGRKHAVLLTSPIQEGSTLVVVASKGGDDQPPAWLLNLISNPEVEVALRGKNPTQMTARVAGTEERARLWPQVTAAYRTYADYQTRTDRQIPLVLLDPVD